MSLAPNEKALDRLGNFFNKAKVHFHKTAFKTAAIPVLVATMAMTGCTSVPTANAAGPEQVSWLQIQRIPASTLDHKQDYYVSTGMPQETIDKAERYIRRAATRIHQTGSDDRVKWSSDMNQLWGDAVRVSSQRDLRDQYTGEFYSCTDVHVRAELTSNRHLNINGRLRPDQSQMNIDRIDRVCEYENSGRVTYRRNVSPSR